MYGTADAFLVYGWMEEDRNTAIKDDWLDKEGLELFASDMVRNHAGNAIYGVRVNVNADTGASEIDKKTQSKVKKAHAKVMKKCKDKTIGELKFLLGLTGDFEWGEHSRYIPGEEAVEPAQKRGRFEDLSQILMMRMAAGLGRF